MKKILLAITCFTSVVSTAQKNIDISAQQYEALKLSNQLDRSKNYILNDLSKAPSYKPSKKAIGKAPSSLCSCMIPLDTTFSLAMAPNDDGSTGVITIPFTFNFYGVNYTSLYINNNGNISFSSPYGTFTASPFPDSTYSMIAPFWADVDTRGAGVVSYKITPTSIIVKWDSVGYFSTMTDKLNTFQLIITDGTDPILPAGNNVSFCYGDMNWTTGSASSGVGGFGGTPATVGTNFGDGVSYFQVGRFDTAGVAFDGPYGSNDQVDWLDNQAMYFNTGIAGNIPPVIINNNICDTIDVYTGDTTHSPIYDFATFTIGASTPEPDQTVSIIISSPDAAALTITPTINLATYKQFDCVFSLVGLATGMHTVTIKATDNGTPAQETSKTIYIRSHYDPLAPTSIAESAKANAISIFPNPADATITVNHNFSINSNPVLTLVNVVGQNIMTTSLSTQAQSVDISNLNKGVYFATITSKEGKSATIKIVRK